MSDSIKNDEKFIAAKYAESLCQNKKILLGGRVFKFGKGWAEIFKEFIDQVGKYPIVIVLVNDDRNFMEIEVEMYRTTRAKLIYKAILQAKYDSLQTCGHCGKPKSSNSSRLCEKCDSNAGKLKLTGTWLDKF